MGLGVRTVVSQLVKPSSPPPYPLATLPSCKLDLVIANIYVKTVYFFRHVEGRRDFFDRHVLMQSLSRALSRFYPIAGTLTASMGIECNGQGALLVEAFADCSLDDLGGFTPDPEFLDLVPTLDDVQDMTSRPLLLVQVTTFKCGGIALGVALEHHVADGVSALGFLRTWCALARGEAITISPWFDKAWLRARSPPTPEFVHDEYLKLPQPKSNNQSLHVNGDEEPTVGMFDLPKEFLQKLKLQGGGELSTYEMLAAHVWRCCCLARMLANNEESMLIMAVDGRTRLEGAEENPQDFVGNVIFNCFLLLTVGEIMSMSVPMLATEIRNAIKKLDDKYCKSAIDFLEMCSPTELARYAKGPHTFASPNLGFISWAKFPFYDIDFGWGSAAHVGPAHVPWEGHAYLLASSPSSSHLRLCINLQRRHMHKFSHLLLDSP